MPPRKFDPTSDDMEPYLRQGLETGHLNWQELAYLDFRELVDLTRKRKPNSNNSEWDTDEPMLR